MKAIIKYNHLSGKVHVVICDYWYNAASTLKWTPYYLGGGMGVEPTVIEKVLAHKDGKLSIFVTKSARTHHINRADLLDFFRKCDHRGYNGDKPMIYISAQACKEWEYE